MRIISWIIALIVGIAVVLFAISNRQIVDIGFWPLDGTISVQLFVAVLAFGFVAFILGGIVSWLSSAPARRVSRHRKRRIDDLEKRIALMEQKERARAEAASVAAGSSHDLMPRDQTSAGLRQISGGRS